MITALPKLEGLYLKEEVLDAAIDLTPAQARRYVWPDIRFLDGEHKTPILLVRAPGAMGKSSAAKATAQELKSPYIDLAKVAIGGDSLTGLLTRVFGWTQAPALVTALQKGHGSLILDGLDEAQLAAGREHFEAFIRNIADLVRDAEPSFQIIIFGRPDVIETSRVAFAVMEMYPTVAELAPLDHGQSAKLIDLLLDDAKKDDAPYRVHREHPKPFGTFRDQVLLDLARAVGEEAGDIEAAWEGVASFLGYPPVLFVLAAYLVVDNPADPANLRSYSAGTRGELLREVVEGVMDREQTKVQHQVAAALGIDDDRRSLLYTREEQVARLLDRTNNATLDMQLPAALNPEECSKYEELIRNFVPDHPFLNGTKFENVVFADYVAAYGTTSQIFEFHSASDVFVQNYKPGPFFAHFAHAMSPGGTERLISEAHIDRLIRSHALGSSEVPMFLYTDVARDDAPALLILTERSESGSGTTSTPTLTFQITGRTGILELSSPLSRGVVSTTGAVVVSSDTGEVILGPSLLLVASELELQGRKVLVQGTAEDYASEVSIICDTAPVHPSDLVVSAFGRGGLSIYWPHPAFQWRSHLLDLEKLNPSGLNPKLVWQAMFGLRRILSYFQASAAADPSIHAERLERVAVGSNEIFAGVLEALIELEVVVREGHLYRLHLSQLSAYGVSWAALRGDDFADTLADLHRAVCKQSPLHKLLTE